jgi:hypothetical protein
MGAPNGSDSGFSEAEVFDLTLLDQLLDRAGHVLDWYCRIHAVLIKQINRVDTEALERRLGD